MNLRIAPIYLNILYCLYVFNEMSLEEMEKSHVARVLEVTGRHRGKACGILGVSRPGLHRIIIQYQMLLPPNVQCEENSLECELSSTSYPSI